MQVIEIMLYKLVYGINVRGARRKHTQDYSKTVDENRAEC